MENYFLKCDISGIQSFIFNVPSKGAAQALKSRSVYIQRIADDCLKKIKNFFGNSNATELYNGGGNFYLKITTDKSDIDFQEFIQKNIYKEQITHDIFAYVSFVKDNGENSGDLLNAVNVNISKDKLHRPITNDLLDAKPITIEKVDIGFIKGINGQVPDGDFEWIASKSDGDAKLAALKLDVDNLGKLFMDRNEEEYRELSHTLKDFFDGKLLQLIKDLNMEQNIYCVFSGGDDCFLIGSWNKIFDLVIALRIKFNIFQRNLKQNIPTLPKEDLTFSAGIVVFQPHYPMLQLANEAEEALAFSKRAEGKNSINVFGKTLTWNEFEKAQKLSKTFTELINNPDEQKKESKSLLQIFRLIYPNNKEMPKVWRLKYYLQRNVKNLEILRPIFEEYSQSLLFRHLMDKSSNSRNPDLYLVASRWAELLTR